MENKRGFYFKLPSENIYYYDDITGLVNGIDKSHYYNENICYGKEVYKTEKITAEKVEEELIVNGYDQLTLIVTHGCNIRCKYCAYSGEYDNNRVHSNINMDFEIARKALLMYFGYVRRKRVKFPLFVPEISFYGGEPLLNFDLIEQAVNFIKVIYEGKVSYNITTNACLLDDKKMRFFAENKFILSISLNGNREEHDRLRVFADGRGTYDYAIMAIKRLHDIYPDYYKELCYVVGVYDHGTNLQQIEEFFEKEEILKGKLLLYAPVIDYGTDWYNQYTETDRKTFLKQIEKLKQQYLDNTKNEKPKSQLQKALFYLGDLQMVNRPVNCTIHEITKGLFPNVGTCIPGHKLAIDPYGVIHACEKVNDKMPLGNVEEGLNYDKIAEILNKYNSTLGPQCVNCPIRRLCPHCFQALLDNQGDFDLSRLKPCSFYVNARINQMIQTYDLLEANVPMDEFLKGIGVENE